MAKNADPQLTFEQALTQLEAIVGNMEQGKIGLQEWVAQCEKAAGLLQHCRGLLKDAETRIQQLQLSDTGRMTAAAFEPPGQE